MALDPIRFAHAALDASQLEREVLGALARDVGFDAAFFAGIGDVPTAVGLDVEALARAFGSRAYDDELLPLKQAALARRGVAIDTEVFGESRVRTMRYFREFAAPVGGRHTLMAYLILRGRPIGAVMLGRCGGRFSDGDVSAIERLLPSLTIARASFSASAGVPRWIGPPLPAAGGSWTERALAWARGHRSLARRDDGDRGILVRDREGHREMVALRPDAELVWSRARLDEPSRSGWFYVDLFHLAAARARSRSRALFIGSGGAVAVRQFAEVYPGIAIDLVDVDPNVIELATDWYGLASIPRLQVHVGDGFELTRRARRSTWDVIIVDAYDASEVPESMATHAFFRAVARALRPGGCVAMNTIGPLAGDGPVRRIERAARAELADVRLVPVLDPGETYSAAAIRNIVVLGSHP